jgi:hypothetical protein
MEIMSYHGNYLPKTQNDPTDAPVGVVVFQVAATMRKMCITVSLQPSPVSP